MNTTVCNLPKPERKRSSFSLPQDHLDWWDSEVVRVKEKDQLSQCSRAMLLRRVAVFDLDLSLDGCKKYKALNLKPKKKVSSLAVAG